VPLVALAGVLWFFTRGWKDDPDAKRWKQLDEERKRAERDAG
jgi:hypothetical protein